MKNNAKFSNQNDVKKLLLFICFLLVTILIYFLSSELGWLGVLNDQDKIRTTIQQIGFFGPLIIVLLIAGAIIISPIPSAPIALVSGALYGHTLGTIYIIVGALSGALLAFMISRRLGHDYFNKYFQSHFAVKKTGSQNALMFIIFISRLAPFISFDVISYAAGLTNLSIWRFFIATLMGIIPVSFILAHLGSEVTNGEFENIAITLIILGFITFVPLFVNKFIRRSD